jgi:gas vesicle protein
MKNSGNVLIGILGAAAAGVVIGMILAPQKGKKLRKDIKESAGDMVDKLGDLLSKGKEKYAELKSMVNEKSDEVKSAAKEAGSSAGDAYQHFSTEGGKAYKKMKS